jgi:hypothetical protein
MRTGGQKSRKGSALGMQNVGTHFDYLFTFVFLVFLASGVRGILYFNRFLTILRGCVQNVRSVGKTLWIQPSITASGVKRTKSFLVACSSAAEIGLLSERNISRIDRQQISRTGESY